MKKMNSSKRIAITVLGILIIICGFLGINIWKNMKEQKTYEKIMPKQEYTMLIKMDNVIEINFSKDYEIKTIGLLNNVEKKYYEENILNLEMDDLKTTVEKIFLLGEEKNNSKKDRKIYTDCVELKKIFKREKVELVETNKINKVIQEIVS